MVNVSAACTPADAAAGGTPRLISRVLEIWPKAMPSAPSTSCAAKPIRTNGRSTADRPEGPGECGLHPVKARFCASAAKGAQASGAGRFAFGWHLRRMRTKLGPTKGRTRAALALIDYLDSVKARDPAARSRWEVLLYPGVLGAGVPPRRALAVRRAALFPRPPGQPFRALPDRDRHPSGRQDRPQLLHRPRLHA